MNTRSHIHTDDIIVDADVHFTIDTTTRQISNVNGDRANKKLTIMQYDNKSERYSFDINRKIDNHDLMLCNRVQVHFENKGSSKSQYTARSYTVTDVHVNDENPDKITFSWLVSNEATEFSGVLNFLVSFECIDGDQILYRWSTTRFTSIQVVAGMNNNDNEIFETYSDDLLAWQTNVESELSDWQNNVETDLSDWQNHAETELLPNLVDECYVERDFATSEEVAYIFDVTDPGDLKAMSIDDNPTDNSENLVKSGGVKSYVDNLISTLEARISALEQS